MKKHSHLHSHTSTNYIELNTRFCQACWKCVETCPNQVLGKIDIFFHKHARVDNAEACKGCKKCVRVCLNGAIMYLGKAAVHEADEGESDRLSHRDAMR